MSDSVLVAGGVPQVEGLSQAERLVDTFVAPRKTFTDILRSTSWWLPFVVMLVVSFVFVNAVDKKVGFDQVAQQQMEKNKFAAAQMESLTPDQRAVQYRAAAKRTRVVSYAYPVVILIFALITAALWFVTINFVFGASTKFSQIFAVWMYAALPKSLMALLAAITLYAGVGTDTFDMQNPVGTNLGYYLTDAGMGLKVAASFLDVFGLWSLALAIAGVAIVSKKSMTQAAIAVGGWWLFGLLLSAGLAAVSS